MGQCGWKQQGDGKEIMQHLGGEQLLEALRRLESDRQPSSCVTSVVDEVKEVNTRGIGNQKNRAGSTSISYLIIMVNNK